jgi:hypothetical protein
MNWLRNVNSQPKDLEPIDPYILSLANKIVGGAKVSDEDYRFFMEETGMGYDESGTFGNLLDRYFDYDEMLGLVLDNMKMWVWGWSMGVGTFKIIWDVESITYIEVFPETIIYKGEKRHLNEKWKVVGVTNNHLYGLDESSPKNIFEYHSYELDSQTLKEFCGDIMKKVPEKEFKEFKSDISKIYNPNNTYPIPLNFNKGLSSLEGAPPKI